MSSTSIIKYLKKTDLTTYSVSCPLNNLWYYQ